MSKDKLISLIIKKQTYKDTKPFLQELAQGKQQAAKVSAEAIRDIITTQYIAEAKLYGIRYLKDAFEQGNPAFINLVESSLLPLVLTIAIDQADEKALPKYAGTTYTKQEQLAKFKSIVSSLFRMAKECILKWASWIPYPGHKFAHAATELRRKGTHLNFQFKYFRPENEQFFIQNCNKNNVQFNTSDQAMASKLSPRESKTTPVIKITTSDTVVKDPLVDAVQTAMRKFSQAKTPQQCQSLQNDFNENLNNYLENSTDFKQDLVQKWFEQFENLKTIVLDRIKNQSKEGKRKQKESKATISSATPTGDEMITPKGPQQSSTKNDKKKANSTSKTEVKKEVSSKKIPSQKQNTKIKEKVQRQQEEFVLVSRKQDKKQQNISVPQQIKEQVKVSEPQIEVRMIQKQKSPKSSSVGIKIPVKGPIIFDSEESSFNSQPPKQVSRPKEQSRKSKQSSYKSKPEIGINKVPKPSPEDARSPRADDNSKWLQDSINQPINSGKNLQVSIPQKQKEPTYKVNVKSSENNILPIELDISKESERVTFSEEQESEHNVSNSRDVNNFKKKNKLAAIQEAFDSQQQMATPITNLGPSKIDLQLKKPPNSTRSQNSSKLLQQNKILSESLSRMAHQLQLQKCEKIHLQKQVQHLSRQLQQKQQSYNHLLKKVKSSVPMQDYNNLKKQLEKYKQESQKLYDERHKLQTQQNSIISQFKQLRDKVQSSPMNDRSNMIVNLAEERNVVRGAGSPIIKEEIDEDYIKNMTHPSNIHHWLNEVNTSLFKKSILGLSEIFYRDQYLTMLSKSNIYTQNNYNFIAFTFTFQFKSLKQVSPQIRYKNCQQLQIWTKPLIGDDLLYTQEIVLKLHRNPSKILKGHIKIIEGMQLTFLIPNMYFNFLREQEVSSEQFEDVYATKSELILKSKIISLNTNIFKESVELKKIFKHAIHDSNKIRFCLAQGISDNVFLGQFELLRNNKVMLKILPIPGTSNMQAKTRQLIEDLSFLIS